MNLHAENHSLNLHSTTSRFVVKKNEHYHTVLTIEEVELYLWAMDEDLPVPLGDGDLLSYNLRGEDVRGVPLLSLIFLTASSNSLHHFSLSPSFSGHPWTWRGEG